jgi:hypothetical protein
VGCAALIKPWATRELGTRMMQSEYERTEKDQVYAQTHVVGKPTKKEVLGRA